VKTYLVYRLDYSRPVREPVGQQTERRRKGQVDNIEDLLKWAERLFHPFPSDSSLVITPNTGRGSTRWAGTKFEETARLTCPPLPPPLPLGNPYKFCNYGTDKNTQGASETHTVTTSAKWGGHGKIGGPLDRLENEGGLAT